MKSQIKGLYITEEDIKFLHYLHAVKVSTYSQINRDIYTTYTYESVGDRVRKMENNKLLEGYQTKTVCYRKKILMLTKKGFDAFIKEGDEQRVELKSDSVGHDLSLVDIRHKLLKQERVNVYLTENELQTWGYTLYNGRYSEFVDLNSDALIEVKAPRGILRIPVEYESFHKSKTRYVDFVDKYYSRDDIPIVLLIYRTNQVVNQLQEIEKERIESNNPDRPKFFYALMSHVLKTETPKFSNCSGDELKL